MLILAYPPEMMNVRPWNFIFASNLDCKLYYNANVRPYEEGKARLMLSTSRCSVVLICRLTSADDNDDDYPSLH